ncbi:MAG TPA: hypothetical protein VNH41_05005 [Steroidobacteraceae bacterium]|nr:hypothetical protein [Steroidobacteraceae bacterium]
MNIDPKNKAEFEAFAIACWLEKATNLRRVIDLWTRYLFRDDEGVVPHDIRQDPASKLIIALLAEQTGYGKTAENSPSAHIKEIRRGRH